jgi:hypothetical protein
VPGEVRAAPELQESLTEPVYVVEQCSHLGSEFSTGDLDCRVEIASQAAPLIGSPCRKTRMVEGENQLAQTRD